MSAPLQSIDTIDLVGILPESIRNDETIIALASAVEDQVGAIATDITAALPLMPNLDNLPSRIIDLLAWQFHVDFYDATATIEARRDRVRAAIQEHRIHGTRAGAEQAVELVFGEDAVLRECWEDSLDMPYCFRVLIFREFTQAEVAELQTIMRTLGNVRSKMIFGLVWNDLDTYGQAHTWDYQDGLGLTWDEFDQYLLYAQP